MAGELLPLRKRLRSNRTDRRSRHWDGESSSSRRLTGSRELGSPEKPISNRSENWPDSPAATHLTIPSLAEETSVILPLHGNDDVHTDVINRDALVASQGAPLPPEGTNDVASESTDFAWRNTGGELQGVNNSATHHTLEDVSNVANGSQRADTSNVGNIEQPIMIDFEYTDPCDNENVGLCNFSDEARNGITKGNQLEDPPNLTESATCSICMEPWTGDGIHRICCLACGHLFGRSCITRWIKQVGKKNGKCPHCNRKAKLDDIRNLYVPFLTILEGERQQLLEDLGVLQLKNQELIAENRRLIKESEHLRELVVNTSLNGSMGMNGVLGKPWHNHNSSRESRGLERYFDRVDLPVKGKNMIFNKCLTSSQVISAYYGGDFFMEHQSMEAFSVASCLSSQEWQGLNHASFAHYRQHDDLDMRTMHRGFFRLQGELALQGTRVFDMDSLSQLVLIAQQSKINGDSWCLNKISLLSMSETGMMPLPQGTGAVRDIRIAPACGKLPGRLSLVASLGKKVSLFSLESNNIVLTYNLQSPCWTCTWDPIEPNHVYVGLQDGSLVLFDLRQTSREVVSLNGLRRQPVHALYCVYDEPLQDVKKNGILSACSSGLCFWDRHPGVESWRPWSVPYALNQGVCVALAYDQTIKLAVPTFRLQAQDSTRIFGSQFSEAAGCSFPSHTQTYIDSCSRQAAHVPMALASSCEAENLINGRCDRLNWQWGFERPMIGTVNPVGMHRSAIVRGSRSESQNFFAFGDDRTKAVMLWDMKSLTVAEHLKPHCSPVLDVKTAYIGDEILLGCASLASLQIYRTRRS